VLDEACTVCAGRGQVAGSWCAVCQGLGWLRQRRRLQICLPGNLQTGTVIRLAGQDARQPASTQDLVLRIKVQPCW